MNVRENEGKTAMMWACINERYCTVELLLDSSDNKSIDLNARDNDGFTALIWTSSLSFLVLKSTLAFDF